MTCFTHRKQRFLFQKSCAHWQIKTRTSHRETNKFCKKKQNHRNASPKNNKPQFVEQGTARVYQVNRAVPEPECSRRRVERGRVKARGRTACLLEVALNFFLVLKEIKSHQQAELQLISKRTKTVDTQTLLKITPATHAGKNAIVKKPSHWQ